MNDSGDEARPRSEAPRQRYDTRRGEVPMRRFGGNAQPQSQPQRPRPEVIAQPKPIDPTSAGMRSVGVRSAGATPPVGECAYVVGDRVEHPKFGVGRIERIEPLATDHKLVVNFEEYGSKTLLAKFAKLTKK